MRIQFHLCGALLLASTLIAPMATAQKFISGKGSLSFSHSSGNTETLNLGGQLHLKLRPGGRFRSDIDVSYDYGINAGEQIRDRIDGRFDLGLRVYAGLVTSLSVHYLSDPFAGYNSRVFIGFTTEYVLVDLPDTLVWNISISPGGLFVQGTGVNEETDEFSLTGHSNLIWTPTPNIALTLDSNTVYAASSTIVTSKASLEFPITGTLKAGMNVTNVYNTDPPSDFKNSDIYTGASLSLDF